MTKRIPHIIILLLICIHAWAQTPVAPKVEMRAVWLTTLKNLDWPRERTSERQQLIDLRMMLDSLKKAGINTVMLQTRVRATTIYPSSIEPWDACFTGREGKAPGYDPLQTAIDECHKRGMQLHAWVVTLPIGKWNSYGCRRLRAAHPRLVKRIGEDGFINPEADGAANYIASICREITRRYDIDGIHLDYIRYPETWPKARGSRTVADSRRANITKIVAAIHHEVKSEKRWVMLSCSPLGKHDDLSRYSSRGWNARQAVSQDAQAWLKLGLMDALMPMLYYRGNNFHPFAIDWQENSAGRIIAQGLGIYFLDPREGQWPLEEVKRQMEVARQIGTGFCMFRAKFLLENHKGIYDFTRQFNTTPSLIPAMTWEKAVSPDAPQNLALEGTLLHWTEPENYGPHLIYNIYASKDWPVNIDDPKNLVATRLMATETNVAMAGRWNYAVTSQDRYGNESKPAMICTIANSGNQLSDGSAQIPIVTGKYLKVPRKEGTFDASFALIENMMGQKVAIFFYPDSQLNVSSLKNGMYKLRFINSRGKEHSLGYFSVKRQ